MSRFQSSVVICLVILGTVLISSINGSIVKKSNNSRQVKPPPTNTQFSRHSKPPLRQAVCNLDPQLKTEIQSYQENATRIVDAIVKGKFKGRTYDELAKFVDRYNHRLFGSQMLEDSINYMMDKMTSEGLIVTAEDVPVPKWIRGEETAEMIEPRRKKLKILGLGPSVPTPNGEAIEAEVLVVHSFEELEEMKDLAVGKIIVYNQGWRGSYGQTAVYRSQGAIHAARVGGIAALVESLAPFSLNNPHTGGMSYEEGLTKIPSASITKEDAELMSRIQARNQTIRISLKMDDTPMPMTTSRNAIGAILGRELPEEIVAVSGHIDCWDVGQGAMDDGGGVLISTEALAVIKDLDLKPRRTMQAILWTAEEPGIYGAKAYVEQHRNELGNMKAVFESDGGTFKPDGLDFAGTDEAACIIQEILNLLTAINTTSLFRYDSVGSDISELVNEGVPGVSLSLESNSYFWYHHSPADTMTVQDTDEMDLCTALWAVVSYVLADLSVPLPRT